MVKFWRGVERQPSIQKAIALRGLLNKCVVTFQSFKVASLVCMVCFFFHLIFSPRRNAWILSHPSPLPSLPKATAADIAPSLCHSNSPVAQRWAETLRCQKKKKRPTWAHINYLRCSEVVLFGRESRDESVAPRRVKSCACLLLRVNT